MKTHKHYELARRAHYHTSFTPEKRAEDFCAGFDSDIAALQALHVPQSKIDRYEALVVRHMQVKSRCLSSMITGPANFPVARAEKANRAEHAASLAATEYYNKIVKEAKLEAYYNSHPEARPVMGGDADAVARLKEKLEKLTRNQEIMVQANKLIRKGDRESLKALLPNQDTEALFKPDFCGRVGFPDYTLTNNRARIKATQDRIAEIESRKAIGGKETTINGVRVLENTEEMRLQLFFEGKPSPAIISTLKSHGFKWSPRNMAWQRLLNNNCVYTFNNSILPVLKGESSNA